MLARARKFLTGGILQSRITPYPGLHFGFTCPTYAGGNIGRVRLMEIGRVLPLAGFDTLLGLTGPFLCSGPAIGDVAAIVGAIEPGFTLAGVGPKIRRDFLATQVADAEGCGLSGYF